MERIEEQILNSYYAKIATQFELNEQFWERLIDYDIFPPDYVQHQKKSTILSDVLKNILVLDIKRRLPDSYTNFSNLLKKHFNTTILDDYLNASNNEMYPIISNEPGYCLIINNEIFTDRDWETRNGSMSDVDIFKKIFSEKLNYKVEIHKNLRKDDMLTLLNSFTKKEELKNHDAFVTIIMSHGVANHIITSDCEKVSYLEIYSIFNNQTCQYLSGKPKIFMFNCCRKGFDKMINKDTESAPNNVSDVFIVLSSLDQTFSNRHVVKGTFFANVIKDSMLDEEGNIRKTDLQTICSVANRKFKTDFLKELDVTINANYTQAIEVRSIGCSRSKFEFKHLHKLKKV